MHKDIVDIEQVLYRCCHAVDRGNIEEIISVFLPEASLVIHWEETGTHTGHAAIRTWFEAYIRAVHTSTPYLRHKISCPLIEVHGDSATAASYLDVDAASKETGQVIITMGRYEDKLERRDGRWAVKEKAIFIDDATILSNGQRA